MWSALFAASIGLLTKNHIFKSAVNLHDSDPPNDAILDNATLQRGVGSGSRLQWESDCVDQMSEGIFRFSSDGSGKKKKKSRFRLKKKKKKKKKRAKGSKEEEKKKSGRRVGVCLKKRKQMWISSNSKGHSRRLLTKNHIFKPAVNLHDSDPPNDAVLDNAMPSVASVLVLGCRGRATVSHLLHFVSFSFLPSHLLHSVSLLVSSFSSSSFFFFFLSSFSSSSFCFFTCFFLLIFFILPITHIINKPTAPDCFIGFSATEAGRPYVVILPLLEGGIRASLQPGPRFQLKKKKERVKGSEEEEKKKSGRRVGVCLKKNWTTWQATNGS